MDIKLIKTDNDYQQALNRLEIIFDAKPGTKEGDELEVLGMLIDNYENSLDAIDFPDPIEAIKFMMEQSQMNLTDLAEILGNKGNISKVLNRKRKLSIEMIRNLSKYLHIPADILIKDYALKV